MNNKEYLLKHFNFTHESNANPLSVIEGIKYRFTVLMDRFIRMEYSENGVFEDRPSQTFFNRYQEKPEFEVIKQKGFLRILTKYFLLEYEMDKPFTESTLSIELQTKSTIGSGIWRYGFTETGNRLGTARTLDGISGKLDLEKGLFSEEGYVIINDQDKLVFEDGWIAKRELGNEDLYFFAYGDDYKDGLRDFYKVSGKTPLIPRFALGNWWSRYWGYSDEELQELINNFEKREIPLSVCIIDMDWHNVNIPAQYGHGWTGYTWNNELFKNPQGLLKWLKDKNIYSSLNLHPADGIRAHETCYRDVGKFMGVDIKSEEPILFDCTDPKFMKAYFEMVHNPLEEIGVDFWWIDWQQGKNSSIPNLDPLWMLNHLHFLDLQRDNEKRGFTFSRYAGLGSHRYPIGFSGDTHVTWESLAFQPYFTANAAKAGYGWWSHDIGGHYHGTEDKELYTRWVQFGVFSPIFRLHTSRNFYHKREPWKWPIENELVVTKYMRLRHKLIPYIYTMAHENENYGLPLIRPMAYENAECNNFKNQYYFGSQLIVSPIINPKNNDLNRAISDIWLPSGVWFDFFTGEHYQGGKIYKLYSKLDEVPVFAKAGAIIPLSELTIKNQTSNPKVIELLVFPGADGEFSLYEDDGISNKYLDNEVVTTHITTRYENEILHLTIHPAKGKTSLIPDNRVYKVNVKGINSSKTIIFEGIKEHKVSIDCKIIDNYNYARKIMELLLDANIETWVKGEIGFIGNEMNKEKGGILGLDISDKEKVKRIKKLKINKIVKEMVINYILKH